MPSSCRLFLAVDLPATVRQQLARLSADLPGARWVDPAQLHLTLRFLGSVPEAEVEPLRSRLARVEAPELALSLAGVGVFPPAPSRRNPPRVLWAGVDPVDPVRRLKDAIDSVLGPDPEAQGRSFSPHVTLARFKEPPGAPLEPYLERQAGLTCAPFPVDRFVLYQSETLADGPRYSVVADYALARMSV